MNQTLIWFCSTIGRFTIIWWTIFMNQININRKLMKNNQAPRVLSLQSNYMHEMKKQRSKLLVTFVVVCFVLKFTLLLMPMVVVMLVLWCRLFDVQWSATNSALQFTEWITMFVHIADMILVKVSVRASVSHWKLCQFFGFSSFALFHFQQLKNACNNIPFCEKDWANFI